MTTDRLETLRSAGMWPAADPGKLVALSDHEFACVMGLMRGQTLKEIARAVSCTPNVVANTLNRNLYRKLGVRHMQGLLSYVYSALAAEPMEAES